MASISGETYGVGCCARAAGGQATKDTTAAPPSSVMNLRRFFDHFVSAQQEGCRHIDTDCSGGLEADSEFELSRLLNRQVSRLCSLRNPIHIVGDPTMQLDDVGSVGEQATSLDPFAEANWTQSDVAARTRQAARGLEKRTETPSR
jgi:hypothetical protein